MQLNAIGWVSLRIQINVPADPRYGSPILVHIRRCRPSKAHLFLIQFAEWIDSFGNDIRLAIPQPAWIANENSCKHRISDPIYHHRRRHTHTHSHPNDQIFKRRAHSRTWLRHCLAEAYSNSINAPIVRPCVTARWMTSVRCIVVQTSINSPWKSNRYWISIAVCCNFDSPPPLSLRKISTQPAVTHIERDCSSACISAKIFIMISIMDRHYILNRTAADNETPLLRMSELLSIQSLHNFNVPASRCSAIACVSDGCWQLKIINFHFAKKNGDECSSRSVIVPFWGRWCGDRWIAWNDRLQFIDCEILRIYYEIHLQWHREWSIGWLDELLRRANHRWRDE